MANGPCIYNGDQCYRILTMPRVFYASTGPDGWVALIIQHVALFFGMAITIILGRVSQIKPLLNIISKLSESYSGQ